MRILKMPRPRVRRTMYRAILPLLASICLIPAGLRSEEPKVYAITNARIFPISGPAIESGTVIVRGGIIESVGAGITIPGYARVIDAKGMFLYPGLIDAMSDIGLDEARPQPAVARQGGPPPSTPQSAQSQASLSPDERQGLTPYVQAADILNPAARKMESARAAGVTTALVAPRKGFFRGESALINLTGISVAKMVVKTPVFAHVGLAAAESPGAGYPGSLMGIMAFIKQTLLDVRHYEAAWEIYNANPGVTRPEYSRALQALEPVVKQQTTVVIPGDTPVQIQRALDLAETFKLRMILAGGAESGKMGPVLRERNVPVLLTVNFPERDRDADPEEEEELAVLRKRVEAPSHAAALADAGVRFAFQSDDMANPRDFIRNVGRTVEAGLDRTIALRALTLTPAEIFGVADKLGTIEKGKCANLVLATGDIFEPRTRVRLVFIDGNRFEIPEAEDPSFGETAATGASGTSGIWSLRVNAPQGPMDLTLKVRQSGDSLTGTLTSPFGTVDISDGSLTGNSIGFKANLNPPGGGSFILEFRGTIKGSAVTGWADAGIMGKMDFTGSKSPNDRYRESP